MGQVAKAVFSGFHPGVVLVSIVAGLILILAANTAFNGFPVLGSILAKDGYLPRQLHTRGDRLAFSNGILILAGAAALLIVIYDAEVTKLIQLYIVGVFVSFTLSQIGMIRHWNRHLRLERDGGRAAADDAQPHHQRRRRDDVRHGAGRRAAHQVHPRGRLRHRGDGRPLLHHAAHPQALRSGPRRAADQRRRPATPRCCPSRVHAIVLVSKIHKPTLRALAYARATRPSKLEAITVNVEPDETKALQDEWDRRDIPVPLKALDSPYREITRPVVEYVKSLRSGHPRDVVVVYIPEYVLGKWYEQVLHNQSALRLKGRLLFTPGVMVASVPWQLPRRRARRSGSTAPRRVRSASAQ